MVATRKPVQSDTAQALQASHLGQSPPDLASESCIVRLGNGGPSRFHNNLIETDEPDAKVCQHAWPFGGNHIISVMNNDASAIGSAASGWIYGEDGSFPESLGVLEFVDVLNTAREEIGTIVEQ